MGSDGDSDPNNVSDIASTLTTQVRNARWMPLLIIFMSFLATVALLLSALAVQKNKEQDARERERALAEVEKIKIQDCHHNNQSRKNQYDSNMTLAWIALQDQTDPTVGISPTIKAFIEFTEKAFEPLDCTLGSPNFGVDLTPPDPPINPLTLKRESK